ncbi:hypothetical protein P9112_003854 [Eukaryota sp. TZLM1-RC]
MYIQLPIIEAMQDAISIAAGRPPVHGSHYEQQIQTVNSSSRPHLQTRKDTSANIKKELASDMIISTPVHQGIHGGHLVHPPSPERTAIIQNVCKFCQVYVGCVPKQIESTKPITLKVSLTRVLKLIKFYLRVDDTIIEDMKVLLPELFISSINEEKNSTFIHTIRKEDGTFLDVRSVQKHKQYPNRKRRAHSS